MIQSFRIRLVIFFAAMVSGTLMFCILMNAFFLEAYYTNSKELTLDNVYSQLKEYVENDIYLTDDISRATLIRICETGGVSLSIITNEGYEIFNYGSSGQNLAGTIYAMIHNDQIDFPNTVKPQEVLDIVTNQPYLQMYGKLSPDTYFIMRIPMESIRQSVNISNRFFMYISYIAIVCSVFLMWATSKTFTRPILQLVSLSERMSNLDFDAKYVGEGNDEIAVLGRSMNKLSSTLEKTISELKSANNELEKDIKDKIEIDNMRKDFLSNVSHELKTPIALIQGYAEGLREGINDDLESREFYCEVIIDEADKMNKLVKNLLTLNQMEFGANKQVMERYDIIALIRGVLSNVSLLIEQNDITVLFDDRKEIFVWADEFTIEQVVSNYINNALNHVDDKKIIRIDAVEEAGNVKIAIYNTGKHIPEEDIEHIWSKFYKVDKARTRAYGGNGIGLSIVKAAMDAHNKKCGVMNVEDGVAFWFELDSKLSDN